MISEDDLMVMAPEIPWRKPLPASNMAGDSGLACRICIAQRGIRGADIATFPKTVEEFNKHMAEAHPR